MVENVPNFFKENAIAGRVMMAHLERIGYHVHYFELAPHTEWASPRIGAAGSWSPRFSGNSIRLFR